MPDYRVTGDTLFNNTHTHAWVCIFYRKGVTLSPPSFYISIGIHFL